MSVTDPPTPPPAPPPPKEPVESQHYAWINTVTDSYTEQLVGRLVRRGWRVAPLGGSLSLHNQDNLSSIVALSIGRTPKDDEGDVTSAKVLDDIKDTLKVLGVHWHSIIVSQPAGCTWTLGNVTATEAKKAEETRRKSVN